MYGRREVGVKGIQAVVKPLLAENKEMNCIIQGDEDELVEVDETVEWVDSLAPGPELMIMTGAEHFFHGRLHELREAVMDFVAGD